MTGHGDRSAPYDTAANPPNSLPFPGVGLPPLPAKWSSPAADAPATGVWENFQQVKITCTMASCEDGLHCYRLTKKLAKLIGPGTCRVCQVPLLSLERIAQRDLTDINHTFAALQTEMIRHYFWHVPFGQKALNYARRAGRIVLYQRIPRRIRSRIGHAEPFRDGTQTPLARDRADAMDYAMHAIAACCRKCANYWHGIDLGRPLTEEEISYLAELARRYLEARLPDLPDAGQYVPPLRASPCSDSYGQLHSLHARAAHMKLPNTLQREAS